MQSPDTVSNDGVSPSSNGASGTRKRKAASGRGVASLTAEQLAKKRQNDREAQRAIRERTKNTIESLEQRIQELTSQQPYQELQAIIRQKDAALAENEEIRRRLAQAVSLLQPLLGVHGLPALSEQLSATTPTSATSLHHSQNDHQSMYQPEQYMTNTSLPPRSVPSSAHHDSSAYANSFPPSENENVDSPWVTQRMALANQRESMHRNHELSENGERLNFSFLIDAIGINGVPSVSDRRNTPPDRTAFNALPDSSNQSQPWTMLPKTCAPTCPLDHILLNFLQLRQRENASYSSASGQSPAYSTPAYPSIANLLNPANTSSSTDGHSPRYPRHMPQNSTNSAGSSTPRPSSSDPISTLMIDIISKFPHISGLPEQVAVLYNMFTHMRWWIYPTQENYDRMPEWMTPRPSQLVTPHPAWIEHLPWPRMRDKVVRNYHNYPFENWFLPFTGGLSVNWPYEPVDCLISTPEQEEPIINPVFQRHISRLDNWSVGPQLIAMYPDLADTCIVKEKVSPLGSVMDNGHMNGMPMPMRQGPGYGHPPQNAG